MSMAWGARYIDAASGVAMSVSNVQDPNNPNNKLNPYIYSILLKWHEVEREFEGTDSWKCYNLSPTTGRLQPLLVLLELPSFLWVTTVVD